MSGTSPSIELLKKSWLMLIVCTVLGGAVGFGSGYEAPFVSTQIYRVRSDSTESARTTQLAQTLARVFDSPAVYAGAARALGVDPTDLQARTSIAAVADTEIVTLTSTAPTAADARAQVDAMTTTIARSLQSSSRNDYDSAIRSGNLSLGDGVLRDSAAEQARRGALGQAVAERQSAALKVASEVIPAGGASEPVPAGLSRSARLLVGLLAGLAGGIALTLAFGSRFTRIRSAQDLAAVVPGVQAYPEASGPRIIARTYSRSGPLRIVVCPASGSTTPLGADDVQRLSRTLKDAFANFGVHAVVQPIAAGAEGSRTDLINKEDLDHVRPKHRSDAPNSGVLIFEGDRPPGSGGEEPVPDVAVLLNGKYVRDFQRARDQLAGQTVIALVG